MVRKVMHHMYGVLALVLFFFAGNTIVLAQKSTKLDSLLLLAGDMNQHDTLRVNAYVRASELVYNRDTGSFFLMLAEKAFSLADSIRYVRGKASALNGLGYYYRFKVQDYDKAIPYFLEGKILFKELGDVNAYGTTCINLGILHQYQGKLNSALEYYFEASEAFDENGEGRHRNSGLGFELIAYIYQLKGDYVRAEEYYNKSIALFRKNKRTILLREVLLALADCYIEQKLTDKALQTIQAARMVNIEGDRGGNPAHYMVQLLLTSSRLLHLQKRCDLCIQKLDSVEVLSKQFNYKLEPNYYTEKASCYIGIKQYDNARREIDRAILLNEKLKSPDLQVNIAKLQATILEKTGNLVEALKLFKLYSTLSDSLSLAKSRINVEDIEHRLEAERKEKEHTVLKMNLAIQQQKVRNQNWLIAIGSVVLILGAGIIFVLFTSRTQIRKKNYLLSEQNKEIQAQNEEITSQHEEITSQTEQLRYKNEYLELQNERLEEINQEKDGLMGVVAHDLRAPLNRTKGLASLLRTRQLPHEDVAIIDKIITVSDEGLRLIKDILDINAIHYESEKPVFMAIHLKTFLQDEIIAPMQESAARKMIELFVVVDDKIELLTDPSSFKRIFENLISNAIKFSPPQTNVIIRATQSHDFVFVGVQDQGPGISADDQRKMFRKFQRLTARPTGGEHSTGLGLSIVKSLVEKLKGEITVESDLDAGTEFIVKLPRQNMLPLSQVMSVA